MNLSTLRLEKSKSLSKIPLLYSAQFTLDGYFYGKMITRLPSSQAGGQNNKKN